MATENKASSRGKQLTILLIVLFVALLAAAGLLYGRYAERAAESLPQASASESERILAPDFTVSDAAGEQVRLSDLRGKPVVLNFWASWCPPCKSEMPGFQSVWEEVGDDIQFMMVDLVDGGRETRALGEAFIAESGYTFPVYYDEGQQAGITYGVASIPTTLFIDAEGYVVTMAQGAIPQSTLEKGIELIR